MAPPLQAFPRVTNTYGSYQVTSCWRHRRRPLFIAITTAFLSGRQYPVPPDLRSPVLRYRLPGLLYPTDHHAPLGPAHRAHAQVRTGWNQRSDRTVLIGPVPLAEISWETEPQGPDDERPSCLPRSLSALSAYHSGVLTPMKMRSESQNTLRLYSGSPTRSDKDTVSISSFYYKERVRLTHTSRTSAYEACRIHRPVTGSGCPNRTSELVHQNLRAVLVVLLLLGRLQNLLRTGTFGSVWSGSGSDGPSESR